jgi:hypothetical protein
MVIIKIKKLILVVDKMKFCKKNSILIIVFCGFLIFCKNRNPAFRFSNFKGTPAENLSKAIEDENIESMRHEVIQKN